MTLYVVAYYNSGWTITEIMTTLTAAQNAFNWLQTLQGTTYAVILSWSTTAGTSWGTPPV